MLRKNNYMIRIYCKKSRVKTNFSLINILVRSFLTAINFYRNNLSDIKICINLKNFMIFKLITIIRTKFITRNFFNSINKIFFGGNFIVKKLNQQKTTIKILKIFFFSPEYVNLSKQSVDN